MAARAEQGELTRPPRVWALLGRKPGDNGQVLALAEAVGWPFETRRLAFRATELLTNRLLGVTLLGLDPARSDPLRPPWPGLVITAGRRNEPVARWLQRRAGGPERCRLVHVGRPWAPVEAFDLIVTTPQYALPRHPRILHTEAPMHRVIPAALRTAAERWQDAVAGLPRPRIAVLLGGHVGPWTFTAAKGQALGAQVDAMARALHGSLLVSTSARTPAEVVDAFTAAVSVPHLLYRWRAADPDNPYLGYLALADRIVVTSDSMSMLTEATATGRPVFVFDLAEAPGEGRLTGRALLFHLGRALGPRQLRRDVTAIHRLHLEAGRAVPLGRPWPEGVLPRPLADAQAAAARVRALFAGPSPSGASPA
ncbi:MAG: mitochondrial fission ELM1 family protein [Geminicoccaceae bacterium]